MGEERGEAGAGDSRWPPGSRMARGRRGRGEGAPRCRTPDVRRHHLDNL